MIYVVYDNCLVFVKIVLFYSIRTVQCDCDCYYSMQEIQWRSYTGKLPDLLVLIYCTVIYFVISTPSAPTAYAWSAACASRQLLSSFTYLMRSDCDIVSAMKSTCAERTANGFRKKRRQSRRQSRSGGVEGIVSGRHEQRRRERKEGSEEKKKKRREKRKEKRRGEGTLCAPDWWLRGTRRPTPTRTAGPRLGPMRTRRRKHRCTVHSCKNRTERHENSDRLMNCSWGKAKCGGGRAHIAAEDCEVLVAGDRVGSAE